VIEIVIFVIKALFTIIWGLLGTAVFDWGIRGIRNRKKACALYTDPRYVAFASKFSLFWILLTLSAGGSMIAAAAIVWTNPTRAALLGLWPPLLTCICIAFNRRPKNTHWKQ